MAFDYAQADTEKPFETASFTEVRKYLEHKKPQTFVWGYLILYHLHF